MCGFENISSNCEILTSIFKHLNFADQLRLSRVCDHLTSFFENHIWTEKYRSLTVISHERFNYVITNETDRNRLCLNANEFEEFLLSYADKVFELTVIYPFLEMEIYEDVSISDHINIQQFPQLVSLRVEGMALTREYLELVAAKCPHLEKLHLDPCSTLRVDTLSRMKHLKHLRLQTFVFAGNTISIDYRTYLTAIYALKLESLKLSGTLEPDPRFMATDSELHLKELYTKTTFDCLKWSENFSPYMATFETLTSLTVEIIDVVTNDILQILAQSCKNLEELTIKKATFENITTFSMPPKVREFSLRRCKGLTVANFRQLLSELKITKFHSRDTNYEGDFNDEVRLSPLIQSLTLDCVYMYRFRKAYGSENTTLKHLNWYHSKYCRSTAYGCPTVCPSLQTDLTIEDPMALLSFCQLKSLNKLTLPHPQSLLDWRLITALLKHPPLTELRIRDTCGYLDPDTVANIPSLEFPINISSLTIPLDIFEMALDFWLDLFVRNDNLRSLCGTFTFTSDYCQFLKKLINHKYFPWSLETIDCFGFTTNCKELKTNFRSIMLKLDRCNCEDLNRILISRP